MNMFTDFNHAANNKNACFCVNHFNNYLYRLINSHRL